MDPADLLNTLSDSEKSTVIRHALPGIDAFLKEILPNVNLNPEAEQLRRQYLEILESQRAQVKTSETQGSERENGKTLDTRVSTDQKFSPDNDLLRACKLDGGDSEFWADNDAASKLTAIPKLHQKDKGDTQESRILIHHEHWPKAPTIQDTSSPTSPDDILSDISADFEVVDWESDATNGNEEGYCTGDNMCLDSSVRTFEISPNESGEIYTGVLYIREYPGWHKRWFTLNDHCLKCFQHRTETKMLFEIPLKGAKLIPTERKKSRVYPIVLSVPRIKECITFAATEEHTRQEWRYVLKHVIHQLEEGTGGGDSPGNESVISLNSLLKGKPVYQPDDDGRDTVNQKQVEDSQMCSEEGEKQKNESVKVSGISEQSPLVGRNKNCKDSSLKESIVQWQVSVEAEDEIMEPSFCASMDEDESFKELQECLPEILQGRKSHIPKKEVKRVLSTGDLPGSTNFIRPPSPSRRSILSTSSSEGMAASMSDLPTKVQVKRQTSLANSLSSKASRVKSRITGSFFKKGKKGDDKFKQYASKSTTFSGYLLRMKGPLWKSRWCVVKEHTLFCYKDFGVGAAELEIHLPGKSVECVAEGDSQKPFAFVISTEKESYSFAAENDAELEEWIMVLTDETKLVTANGNPEGAKLSPGNNTAFVPGLERDSRSESANWNKTRKSSPTWKKDKSTTPVSGKKSILSSLGHKFGKNKTKAPQSTTGSEVLVSARSVEDSGVFIVPPSEKPADNSTLVANAPSPQLGNSLEVPNPCLSGFLNQCVHSNTWLKCWVKLEDHFLHIHDDKDREDAVVVKFKLSNCVVLDSPTADRPHIIEIRRNRSQPIYLQAQSEKECNQWKTAISESVIESPLPARRFQALPAQSSLEDNQAIPQLRLTSGGDSFEQEVFKHEEQRMVTSLNLPLNPSPRPSTAGDVSSVESEEDGAPPDTTKPADEAGGSARLRSFSEGEQDENHPRNEKSAARVRRSLSNALLNLDVTAAKKRRNKTLSGIKVPPELLVNMRHSSCLYLRNSKALWSKRWAILQTDVLHLFKRADDISPCVSINVQGCEVRPTSKKTKKFAFELTVPAEKKEYCFAADNQKELRTWMDLLQVSKADEEGKATSGTQKNGKQKSSPEEPKDPQEGPSLDGPQRKLAIVDAPNTEEPGAESRPTGSNVTTSENSPTGCGVTSEMHTNRESVGRSDSCRHRSNETLQQSGSYEKPASLDAVLRLLQDQQLVQQIGQRRFEKARKVQNAWKRSAVAAREAARDQSSRPESPDGDADRNEPARRRGSSVGEARHCAGSGTQISLRDFEPQSSADIIEKFEKLAEEEKQRALKTETLLKKRRNSLNLEKDVLERKLVKGQEKKSAMKKLLGKDETETKEDLRPAEKRLGDVELELENIQRNIDENRRQQSEVLESLNTLKTRTVRKYSFRNESNFAATRTEERRVAFRSSPSESASSQGSVDDRTGREPDSLPRTPDPSRKKSSVETLAALEQELRKFSPLPRRAPDVRKKRVSISSEGTASPDDGSTKGSPTPAKKSEIRSAEHPGSSDSPAAVSPCERPVVSEAVLDSTELRRKRFSGSSRVSFHKLSVEIPTDDESHLQDVEEKSKSNTDLRQHKVALVDALSQIKDFEEFAAGSLTEKFGNPKMP